MGDWCPHRRQMGASSGTTWHHVAWGDLEGQVPTSPPSTQDCEAVTSVHLSIGFYFLAGQSLSLLTPSIPSIPNSRTLFLLLQACLSSSSGLAFCASANQHPQALCSFNIGHAADRGPGSSLCTHHRELRHTLQFYPPRGQLPNRKPDLPWKLWSHVSLFYYTFSHPSPGISSVSNAHSHTCHFLGT